MSHFNGRCPVKLLFDQNLSRKLVNRLIDLFPDSSHVQFHNMPEADDAEIWEFAKANGFCIVTQDTDFADRSRLYGAPPKVVWLRCGNTSTPAIEQLLREGESAIHELMASTILDCLELY
jgi:predicted nuclease of predicted toxin-antitoxin system